MKTLIKNGTIVTAGKATLADLLMDNGMVRAVGPGLASDGASVIDAGGRLVLPGGVDAHTHITLNLDAAKGTDVYYSGTIPAAVGGTTTIIDHLAFMPPGRRLEDHIAAYRALATGNATVDYLFHGLAQGPDGVNDLDRLPEDGFSSVKAYMTYNNPVDGEALSRLLRRTKELGLLLAVHAEDDTTITELRARFRAEGKGDPVWHAASRPPQSEAEAVERLLHLAAEVGDAPVYIVHLSSAAGLAAIRKALAAGQKNVYAETCTQYLCLTDEMYRDPVQGLRAVMAPPLRKPEDIGALWDGIGKGEIQVAATDHCPFTLRDKMAGLHNFTLCPGGAPGLEERFTVLYSEGVAKRRISLERFVEIVSTNPAKLFGLYPKKGELVPGSDADVVIFDPTAEYTLHTSQLHGPSDFSLYDGMRLTGRVERVFLRGKLVAENSAFTGARGMGLPLTPREITTPGLPCRTNLPA